jgi:hypothetical protein
MRRGGQPLLDDAYPVAFLSVPTRTRREQVCMHCTVATRARPGLGLLAVYYVAVSL